MAAMSPLSKGGAEPVANQVYKYEVRSGGVISFRVPVYQKMMVAALSGVLGTCCIYPLDVAKNRTQTSLVRTNVVQQLRAIVREGGLRGMYRGLPANLVGVAPEKALKLGTNDVVRGFLSPNPVDITLKQELVAGATAGFVQCVATNPMEVTKLRIQLHMAANPTSAVPSALGMARSLGIRGLYQGLPLTLSRDVPYCLIFFPMYANVKTMLTDEHGYVSKGRIAASGVVAGIVSSTLFTPVDVIKTIMQTANCPYATVGEAVRDVFSKRGVKGFFRGAGARAATIGPLYGITLLAFELQKKYLMLLHRPPGAEHRHQASVERRLKRKHKLGPVGHSD